MVSYRLRTEKKRENAGDEKKKKRFVPRPSGRRGGKGGKEKGGAFKRYAKEPRPGRAASNHISQRREKGRRKGASTEKRGGDRLALSRDPFIKKKEKGEKGPPCHLSLKLQYGEEKSIYREEGKRGKEESNLLPLQSKTLEGGEGSYFLPTKNRMPGRL